MNKIRFFSSLIVFVIFLNACDAITGYGSYKPPLIPLTITVDTNGNINFELNESVSFPTPIGTFTAGVVVDPAAQYNAPNTLVVRLDGQDHIYDLHGEKFDIQFESAYYEKINLTKDGKNLILTLNRLGGSSGATTYTIALSEKLGSGYDCGIATLEKMEVIGDEIRIYFKATFTELGTGIYDCQNKPELIYLTEHGTFGGQKGTVAQNDLVLSEHSELSSSGYVVFSTRALSQSRTYRFTWDPWFISDDLPYP